MGKGCLLGLEEHVALDLGVASLSPTLGVEITKKINKLKKKKRLRKMGKGCGCLANIVSTSDT